MFQIPLYQEGCGIQHRIIHSFQNISFIRSNIHLKLKKMKEKVCHGFHNCSKIISIFNLLIRSWVVENQRGTVQTKIRSFGSEKSSQSLSREKHQLYLKGKTKENPLKCIDVVKLHRSFDSFVYFNGGWGFFVPKKGNVQ